MERIKVGGVIQSEEMALINITSSLHPHRIAAEVFNILGAAGINVEFLAGAFERAGTGVVGLCVHLEGMKKAVSLLDQKRVSLEAEIEVYPHVVVLSLFGPHFREKPHIAGTMFSSLAGAGIDLLALGTSISSLSGVVREEDLEASLEILKRAFDIPQKIKSRPKDY